MTEFRKRRSRSLFWPIILIGVGVLLLMQNLGYMGEINWWILAQLWPVLIIAAGLDVLMRDVPWAGTILGALLAAGVVAALYFAPQLNLRSTPLPDLKHESFVESRDGAETASITLDVDRGDLNVFALGESSNILEIEADHRGSASLSAGGSRDVKINFRLQSLANNFPFFFFGSIDESIDAGINAAMPVELNVDHGSGQATLDLKGLNLTHLEVDNGSGSVTVDLPSDVSDVDLSSGSGQIVVNAAAGSTLDLKADVGSGRIQVNLSPTSSGTLNLSAGSGSITFHIPEGIGVQLIGSTGSGAVRVPEGYDKISGDERFSGTWQSSDFDTADLKLLIRFDIGSGILRIEP
jgi:hypothetical protein